VNNYLWAYQIDTGERVRLLSASAGAEITGLRVADNLNGFILEKAVGSACRMSDVDLKGVMKKCVVTLLVISIFFI